jgi:alpha-D-xyloside xylohydrolase
MRLHGVRRQAGANIQPGDPIANPEHPNVANEVWSYGEETWAVLSDRIRLRERLRPCVMKQKKLAETTSLPPMRPLFVDFPDDPHAWVVEDQFLFGSELLVAPILSEGARSRTVFLRDGSKLRLSGA